MTAFISRYNNWRRKSCSTKQENYHRRKGFTEMDETLRQGSTQKSVHVCVHFTYKPEGLQIHCSLSKRLKEKTVRSISIPKESIVTHSKSLALP